MDDKQLTSKLLLLTTFLPCGIFPWTSESTGSDDVLLILGLNNFVRENEPRVEVFSHFPGGYASGT